MSKNQIHSLTFFLILKKEGKKKDFRKKDIVLFSQSRAFIVGGGEKKEISG